MNVTFIMAACRLLLGLVFLAASAHKILDAEAFAMSIYQYQLLPESLVNGLAITLPWIELVAGIAIIVSARFKDGAALLMLVMLGVFALAISINLLRGLDIACGCFSAEGDVIGWGNVFRNLGYMFLALVILCEKQVHALLRWR